MSEREWFVSGDKWGFRVVNEDGDEITYDLPEHSAYLIAAAPKLLAACEALMGRGSAVGFGCVEYAPEQLDVVREAIADAKPPQPAPEPAPRPAPDPLTDLARLAILHGASKAEVMALVPEDQREAVERACHGEGV